MVTIASSTKLWAFALSEQLQRYGLLNNFYTTYAYNKNTFINRFVKRIDKEDIPVKKIKTIAALAFPIKLLPAYSHIWNEWFDRWVANQLTRSSSQVFIGWSGMSLNSIKAARKKGMTTIVERGSTHILYQNNILKEEYEKFSINFSIHPTVINKELKEYEEADYISIPSYFVKNSFIAQGVSENKLIMNPYGTSDRFVQKGHSLGRERDKFIIVYLGTLSIRKGLLYLFQALHQLNIPVNKIEVWFIGSIAEELKPTIEMYRKDNWKFFGHINHYELGDYLSQCDVGIQPSVEEGLSMVIPQLMACGVPVIVTPNSGGENVVSGDVNGFVVPIRNPAAISEKIEALYNDRKKLESMKRSAADSIKNGFTWNDYGARYLSFINSLE